jgi:hypothetical protein
MINDRDDWLSPAAFVAGVDFEAKPPVTEGIVEYHSAVGWNPRPEWMVIEAQSPANPAPVLVYDPSIDERVPVTQEWVDLAVRRMTEQRREILRLLELNHLVADALRSSDDRKVGSILRIRIPADYTVYDGPALKMENLK